MAGNTSMEQFLDRYRLKADSIDFDPQVERFLQEMDRGLSGEPSSLAMIPAWVGAEGSVAPGEPVIVLDAGGTNFRAASYHFDSRGEAVTEHFAKSPMPGTRGRVGRDQFFRQVAEKMAAVEADSEKIGFCFSYPTEILPDRDGRLIRFTKEVDAPELEGELIGAGLNTALQERYGRKKQITILNDTVATMLAGKARGGDSYSGYIGFILGTGTNCAYLEQLERIGTIGELVAESSFSGDKMAINMESGGFSGFPGGEIDQAFFASTDKPELFHFEKMVSGAYLGPLALAAAKQAAREGLFSEELTRYLQARGALTTVEMDRFLHHPEDREQELVHHCSGTGELQTLFRLFDALVERAARLAALELTGVVLKTGAGMDPEHPVAIVADGTTFYKTFRMARRCEDFLKKELQEKRSRFFRFLSVENAPAVGAAVAGLLN